jgi:VanZ family protein
MSSSNQSDYSEARPRPAPAAAPGLAGRPGTALALLFLMLLLVLHQAVTFGSDHPLGGVLRSALHIPLFAMLTLLLSRILGSPRWWVLLSTALLLAIATEVVQAFTGRNASVLDVAVDLIGIVPVVAGLVATRRLRRRGAPLALIVLLWLAIAGFLGAATVAAPIHVLLGG